MAAKEKQQQQPPSTGQSQRKKDQKAKHFVTNPKHPQGRRRVIKRAL